MISEIQRALGNNDCSLFLILFPSFLFFLYHKVGPFRDKMPKCTCNKLLILTSKTPLAANTKLHCNMVTSYSSNLELILIHTTVEASDLVVEPQVRGLWFSYLI